MKLEHKDSLHAQWNTIVWILNVKRNSYDCLQTIQEASMKYEGENGCCSLAF